jgi:hypothetical protein
MERSFESDGSFEPISQTSHVLIHVKTFSSLLKQIIEEMLIFLYPTKFRNTSEKFVVQFFYSFKPTFLILKNKGRLM